SQISHSATQQTSSSWNQGVMRSARHSMHSSAMPRLYREVRAAAAFSERPDRQAQIAPEYAGLAVHHRIAAIELVAGTIVGLVAAAGQPGGEHPHPDRQDVARGAFEWGDGVGAARDVHHVDEAIGLEVRRHDDARVVAVLL